MKILPLLLILLLLPLTAFAEETIHLEHVPEPTVIDLETRTWFAYTWEEFLLLAEMDVRLQTAAERERTLRLHVDDLEARMQQAAELVEEHLQASEDLLTSVATLEEEILTQHSALETCERRLHRRRFFHPVWTATSLGLGVLLAISLSR